MGGGDIRRADVDCILVVGDSMNKHKKRRERLQWRRHKYETERARAIFMGLRLMKAEAEEEIAWCERQLAALPVQGQ